MLIPTEDIDLNKEMGKAIAVFLVLLIVGVLAGLGMSYSAANSLEVSDVSMKGFNIGLTSMSIDLDVVVRNRSQFPLQLRDIDYRVTLAGREVATGYKPSLYIPSQGTSSIPLNVKVTILDVIQYVASILSSQELKGSVIISGKVPLTLFGLIELPISIPFSYEKELRITPTTRALQASAYWLSDSISVSQCVEFIANIGEQAQYVVEVREDRSLAPDRSVAQYNAIGDFKGRFCLNYTPETNVRGFFLKIKTFDGREWQQESSYPPRLKLVVPRAQVYASWDRTSISPNECTSFTVSVKPATSFIVEVREDVKLGADRTIATYEGYGSLSQQFCLSYRPSGSVRGYFLRVTLSSGEIWEQEGYPPRLALQMPVKGRLSVVNVWWSSDGRQVTSVKAGKLVTTHVLVTAIGGDFSGKIEIVIKQDIALSPDVEVRRASFTVSLAAGESRELMLSFTPQIASGDSVRGYHVEVYVNGVKVWSMPDSYPPRLYVEVPRRGIPVVEDVYFAKDGVRISQAGVGERIEVHIFIRAEGGDLSGEITIRIRKDIAFGADEDYIVKTITMNVPEGRRAHITLTFVPNQRSGGTFRGLFVQIDLISWGETWTMPSSYPPRLRIS